MQEYDIALKSLLKGSAPLALRAFIGTAVAKWLDIELPKVQNLRVDLLAETVDGELVHLELQARNDPAMPFRMLEYGLGVQRQTGRFPRQVLLYVGEAPLRMESGLSGPDLSYEYQVIDIRMVDGEGLLDSEQVGDNVIAILAQLRDDKGAVHRIVERIAGLPMAVRETALAQLMILAGLRHLAATVEEEQQNMPIDLDIRDHEVIGPMIIKAEQQGLQKGLQEGLQEGLREGLREGLQEGLQNGLQKGLHAGELAVLRRLLQKRFGALPGGAVEKLAAMSASELEDLSERVLDAASVDELLR